jgi:hypothetical protein
VAAEQPYVSSLMIPESQRFTLGSDTDGTWRTVPPGIFRRRSQDSVPTYRDHRQVENFTSPVQLSLLPFRHLSMITDDGHSRRTSPSIRSSACPVVLDALSAA